MEIVSMSVADGLHKCHRWSPCLQEAFPGRVYEYPRATILRHERTQTDSYDFLRVSKVGKAERQKVDKKVFGAKREIINKVYIYIYII